MRRQVRASSTGSSMRRAGRSAAACLVALVALLGIGASAASAASPTLVVSPATPSLVTARANGTIITDSEANGGSETYWFFQYTVAGQNEWSWGPEAFAHTVPAGTETEVSERLTGLKASTAYEVRLAAFPTSDFIEVDSLQKRSFTTAAAATAPLLGLEAPAEVKYTTAKIAANLNPEGGNEDAESGAETSPGHFAAAPIPIHWVFEITREGEGWNPAAEGDIANTEPEGGGPIPAEVTSNIPLSAELSSLSPGKTYKFRLKATYAGLEALSPEEGEFTTEAVAAPVVTTADASAVTDTSAHFEGTVELAGEAPAFTATCLVEYTTQKAYEEAGNAFPESPQLLLCEPYEIPGSLPQPVAEKADATELQPNTTYHFRIAATNAGGTTAVEAEHTFSTEAIAPTLGDGVSTPEAPGGATLRGYVDPHNTTVTDCHFDYGLDESYGQSAPCEGDPNGPGPFGPEPPAFVTARLTGLDAGATYHYRLVVSNGVGSPVEGADRMVHVPAQANTEACPNGGMSGTNLLPDCRAWELASPPDKSGGDVLGDVTRVRPAVDGQAVAFASLAGFGDVEGTGFAAEYMSLRTGLPNTNGWTTHGIFPKQDPLVIRAINGDPGYVGELSPDLDRGIFKAWTPLTEDPTVADAKVNLYSRTGLRQPGADVSTLMTGCPLCVEKETALPPTNGEKVTMPVFGGASEDLSKIAYERPYNSTAADPAQPAACDSEPYSCDPRAYESEDGVVRLAGVVPPEGTLSCGGEGEPDCEASPASIVGSGVGLHSASGVRPTNVVSSDGANVFFTVPTNSGGGISAFRDSGRLYDRIGGTRTVRLDVSERTDCAGDPTCGGDGEPTPVPTEFQPAHYWGATRDGSRVFFTSSASLTDDAPSNSTQQQLYMYNTEKLATDSHNLTLVSLSNPKAGAQVVSISGIGGEGNEVYVYFVSYSSPAGNLVSGGPTPRGYAFYVWHDGHVSYLGRTEQNTDEIRDLRLTEPEAQGRVTPDGRYAVLALRDPGGFAMKDVSSGSGSGAPGFIFANRQLYLYSAEQDELVCISCQPGGGPTVGGAAIYVFPERALRPNVRFSTAITADGSRVFFSSTAALVAEDTNSVADAYEYETDTGQVHLLSSGTDPSPSYFMDVTANGADAFFVTRAQLVGWDIDQGYDLYDARVNGGFAEPPPPEPVCGGDSCRGEASVPPVVPTVGSEAVVPSTNRPPNRCRKKSTRKAGKRRHCARKHHHAGRTGDNGKGRGGHR